MARRSWFGQRKSTTAVRKLEVEQLEDRCLLSAAISPGVIPTPNVAPMWLAQAVNLDTAPKGNPQVVFLGDSITAGYGLSPSWNASIAPLGASDLAIGGSTTQNVLWQLDTGLLAGTAPKVIVLMIGINNLGTGQTPAQTAEGVAATVSALRVSQPQARILLLGILPSNPAPDSQTRLVIAQTNSLIAGLDDGSAVHFLDIGNTFLQPDGTLSSSVMADYLHPTALGYQLLTEAIEQPLEAALAASLAVAQPPPQALLLFAETAAAAVLPAELGTLAPETAAPAPSSSQDAAVADAMVERTVQPAGGAASSAVPSLVPVPAPSPKLVVPPPDAAVGTPDLPAPPGNGNKAAYMASEQPESIADPEPAPAPEAAPPSPDTSETQDPESR